MADEPYSVREIQALFKAADDRADEFHGTLMSRMDAFEDQTTSALERIEQQTRKTNGRVSALETYIKMAAVAIAMLIILKFPELLAALKLIGV